MGKDRPRSTSGRAKGAALLSGAVSVVAISSGIAAGAPAYANPAGASSRTRVVTLSAGRAAPISFVGPTASTAPATTVPETTTTTPSPRDVAAALRYMTATNASSQAASAVAVAIEMPSPAPDGSSVQDAINTYFGDVFDKALRVATCESHLDPNAVSAGGGNYGLFQINFVHRDLVESMGYSWDQIFDPYVNSAVARRIYDNAGGWSPWGCRRA